MTNGELDDRCRNCSASIVDSAPEHDNARRLRQQDSHTEAPAKKTAKPATEIPVPDEAPAKESAATASSKQQDSVADSLAGLECNEAHSSPVTLDAMREMMGALLDQKLHPVSTAISKVETDLNKLQTEVKTQFATFQIRLDETVARVTALEDRPSQPAYDDSPLQKRISEIEQMLSTMKIQTKSGVVAVVGNLQPLGSEEAATNLILSKLSQTKAAKPIQTYVKGSFSGMVWLRFATNSDMMCAVEILNNFRIPVNEKTVWAGEDLPIEKRVPRSFLFGCKKLLASWGYKKSLVKVDTDALQLKINSQLVISAITENDQLKVSYHGDFTNWAELQTNSEIKELKTKATSTLTRPGDGEKGTGKGAAGSTQ